MRTHSLPFCALCLGLTEGFVLQEGFLVPLSSSKSSGLGRKGWGWCDLVQFDYVPVSFEFVATAPVWGQLDLISNLLCCIYWNGYVMPPVFMMVPITFVTFKLQLWLWVEYWDFPFSLLLALAQYSTNVAAVSRSDLDNYSVFFLAPFEHYQQEQQVHDTRAAYGNEQTKGKTRQMSRGHLPLCETQWELTLVVLSFTGDQKE